MMKIPGIPGLPEKEELEYKQKQFFLSLYEQFQSSSKVFLYVLAGAIILAIPLKIGLQYFFTKSLVAAYKPPYVNTTPYTAQPLQILKIEVLPINPQSVSLVAQILNPNGEISAGSFHYKFILEDEQGQKLKQVTGESFVAARESKFLLEPVVSMSPLPVSAKFTLEKIRWTKLQATEIKLEVLQKNSGLSLEGNFFVEGLVKNQQGFGLKKILVNGIVFDSANQHIVAVNNTVLTDIKPFESRYFRMIWPRKYNNIGEIQVVPVVNLLDPALSLEKTKTLPAR